MVFHKLWPLNILNSWGKNQPCKSRGQATWSGHWTEQVVWVHGMINLLCVGFTSTWTYPVCPGSACLFLSFPPLEQGAAFLLWDFINLPDIPRFHCLSGTIHDPRVCHLNNLFWCWWRSLPGLLVVTCVLDPVQVGRLGFLSCTSALCVDRTPVVLRFKDSRPEYLFGSLLTSTTALKHCSGKKLEFLTGLANSMEMCVRGEEESSRWTSDSMDGE